MSIESVIFLIIAVAPIFIGIGAWSQRVIFYLEDIRQAKRD